MGGFGRTWRGRRRIGLWKRNVVQNTTSPSLPGAAHLGGVSYTMLAEAAFPLKPDPMRPDPGQNLSHNKRIFNYRLSRVRMVVEEASGILVEDLSLQD